MSATLEDASRSGMITIGYGMYSSSNNERAKETTSALLQYLSNKHKYNAIGEINMIKRKSYAHHLKSNGGRA